MTVKNNLDKRQKIKFRIRKRISGSSERPRLVIFRSLNNIYAQLVDDINHRTICTVSNLSKEVKDELKDKTTKLSESKIVGKFIASKAKEKNIRKAVFDRNGYLYHGRVKAVADGAREGGLEL
ncbi:50S ribosomal protein L18 [bacterium BMS3Abin03]|nr:50S ribosomal protein L18 [bacterium BMS3Abin03]